MSDSLQPPTDGSPARPLSVGFWRGENTGAGCHFLLQGVWGQACPERGVCRRPPYRLALHVLPSSQLSPGCPRPLVAGLQALLDLQVDCADGEGAEGGVIRGWWYCFCPLEKMAKSTSSWPLMLKACHSVPGLA